MPHRLAAAVVALVVLAAACSGDGDITEELDGPTIGFIFVGAADDLGYNQAAWEGSEALARAYPSATLLRVPDVPEDETAVDVLEGLVDDGATILFATSFGHHDAALEVARRHPDVTVLHQGATPPAEDAPNFGTYFGTHAEALHAAGIAAADASTTGRIGFVAAFPIPATWNNVNALLLGARSRLPEATVRVAFTDDWCDPDRQDDALDRLEADGAEVLAMHQDCTGALLERAEREGLPVIGYHADGSEVAPTAWLMGAVWDWGPLYRDVVAHVLAGTFETSRYAEGFRGDLVSGDNPLVLSEPGPSVSPETVSAMEEALRSFATGDAAVFSGPLLDADGVERVPAGTQLTREEIDAMDWAVEGVEVLVAPAGQ